MRPEDAARKRANDHWDGLPAFDFDGRAVYSVLDFSTRFDFAFPSIPLPTVWEGQIDVGSADHSEVVSENPQNQVVEIFIQAVQQEFCQLLAFAYAGSERSGN
jgi:hypothetical protein